MARPTTAWLKLLLRFALDGLAGQRGRSGLTMLGLAIGTASVVGVVSIGLLGRTYVVNLIEGVGSNLVFAYGTGDGVNPEEISFEDLDVLRARVPGVRAMAPVLSGTETLSIKGESEIVNVLGATPAYAPVRNLVVVAGRFPTERQEESAEKVCIVSRDLARRLWGDRPPGEDEWLRLFGLRFRVVGVYREGVESAAAVQKSEAAGLTVVVPFSTFRNLYPVRFVDVVYFQAESPRAVSAVLGAVSEVLKSRHRALSSFKVESLQGYLILAQRISDAVTLGLIAIAAVSLLVGGIGIMNILLVSVTERTREIGIRMAVGARQRHILLQFLVEAVALSVAGGIVGVMLGAGAALLLSKLAGWPALLSPAAIAGSVLFSGAVGVFFGFYPARRAARLDPITALRYE